MDRPSGTVIRRQIVHDRPGELVQVDVKKLGRIPPGGGWRAWGRGNVVEHRVTQVGYAFVHTAIDSHTRLAYSEVLPNEQGATAAAFWTRAHHWFADLGITIETVQTDNGACRAQYTAPDNFGFAACRPLLASRAIGGLPAFA